MLYDPKWEKQAETKADPLSLPTLIEWLEKQPADKPYCYGDGGACLMFHYFTAMGFRVHGCGGSYVRITPGNPNKTTLISEPFQMIASEYPHLYGDALARAREYPQEIS